MSGIHVYHNSRELACRSPFGALPCGASASLRICVWGDGAECVRAFLRTWYGKESVYEGERSIKNDRYVFTFTVKMPEEPCVLWYNFRLETPSGTLYAGAPDGVLRSGQARLSYDMPFDYRITVFDRGFDTPEAFKGSTAYQIFPDRFKRGEHALLEQAKAYHRFMGRRVSEKAWDEDVDHLPRDGEKFYSPQDYYFGNFRGIIDSIPYLKSLGISVLYLNPIFESAYNHRYSVADYMKVDPLLGTEEDFRSMALALSENGISLILDGVFSHTGADSVYFDANGVYGSGAYHNADSPYREWYDFSNKYKHGYRCWWDFESLPEVEELTPSYKDFIAGVLEKWIKNGAAGFRLDVADELPDEFIKFLRSTLKKIDPNAVLIGEVWEDAALKKGIDGKRREYVNGLELDGVMDYPFRDAVIDFMLGSEDASFVKAALGAQLEGYPNCFMRSQLGLLGSHDTCRILSALSGAGKRSKLPRELQAAWDPGSAALAKGRKRLMAASALQFSMPFMPCIYYGDEAGLSGLEDPFSRRPYPWGHEDEELLSHYRRLAKIRAQRPVFIKGDTAFASFGRDVFAIARSGCGEALTIVNRSDKDAAVSLRPEDFSEGEGAPSLQGVFEDLFTGARTEAFGCISITVPACGFSALAKGLVKDE